MINRIQQIIEKYGLSAARFADQIHVQRANLSHILTGRNKPSLDFITKILTSYPAINSDWLLFGKGKMELDENPIVEKVTLANDQQSLNLDSGTISSEVKKRPVIRPNREKTNKAELKKKPDKIESSDSSIKKIVIFFNNGTYQEFKADE